MLYKPGNMITCGQFAVDYVIVDDEEVKSHLKKGWVKKIAPGGGLRCVILFLIS